MMIKYGLVALLVTGVGGLGISKVKSWGYEKAHAECVQAAEQYQKELNVKIDNIIVLSNELAKSNRESSKSLSTDINSILKNVKGKTLTIIKNGECTPSPEISDSLSKINKRINQSMKGDLP